MMLGFNTGIFDMLLLIAIGIGYIVLYFAKREEKGLQFLGYIIGALIIALATAYMLGNFLLLSKIGYPNLRYYKGMMRPRMMQQQRMMPQPIPQKAPLKK